LSVNGKSAESISYVAFLIERPDANLINSLLSIAALRTHAARFRKKEPSHFQPLVGNPGGRVTKLRTLVRRMPLGKVASGLKSKEPSDKGEL